MKTILVTGISGYLGLHIAMEGIRRGYRIRGTVRSAGKASEVQAVFSEAEQIPELFTADLLNPEGWSEAVASCDAVMHVASPFLIELPAHEDELIRPAVLGVKHVMEAAFSQGVSRIIQTSSIAAIVFGHEKQKSDFTEQDWTIPEGRNVSPYYKSKTLAEKAFWDFGRKHEEMKLTSICPGFVLGPLLSKDTGTSVEVLVRMMQGKYPGVPRLGFPCVDVRDVAALHWDALEAESSTGKRYAAVAESLWFRQIASLLRDAAPDFKSKVSNRELPDWFVRIFALFDKPTRMILPELGFMAKIVSKAGEELGFRPRGMEESIRDSVESLFARNIFQRQR